MTRIVENALAIYTDGSLYQRGRQGGYAIVYVHIDQIGEERVVAEFSPPGVHGTTNNRMELQACIDALTSAPQIDAYRSVDRVVIRTDSRYVADHYMTALAQWRTAGWKNRHGRPVDNADLWKDFVRAFNKLKKRTEIEWVKGHGKRQNKDPHNVRADKLAKESAKSPLSKKVHRSSVRRKITDEQTERGSVRIEGQQMTVYVVETEWLRVNKIWKYRYEVASPSRKDFGKIDWIYSKQQMRDGHYYEVKVNDDMAYPQVLEVIREV